MKKRISLLILSSLILSSVMMSCGDNAGSSPDMNDEPQNTAAAETSAETEAAETEIPSGLPDDLDFGGYNFRWLTSATNSNNTITVYNEQTGDGTGFMFDSLTPSAIYNTVGWAVWAFYNRKDHIAKMQKRAMTQDFTWKASCDRYVEVYNEALFRGCGR